MTHKTFLRQVDGQERDSVWLIHKTWEGDTSARLLLFTYDLGLIHATFKGGRSPKKQGLLQAFMPLWVSLNQHRDWYYVQHMEAADAPIRFNQKSLYAALYLNELIYLSLRPRDPYPELFDDYSQTLIALGKITGSEIHHPSTCPRDPGILGSTEVDCAIRDQTGSHGQADGHRNENDQPIIEVVLRRFERCLLAALGYGISLTQESLNGEPIEAERYYQLVPNQGLVSATQGFYGAHILAWANDDWTNPDVLKTAKRCMRILINHCLNGKPLKSRELFKANI